MTPAAGDAGGPGGDGPGARATHDAPAPCTVRDGRLHLDGLDLAELVAGLEGRAAWVLSHRAITEAIGACDGARTVSVARVGPPAVLGLFAAAGWWARCRSPRELEVARAAGFPADRLVATGGVKDDGFVKDALTLRVGALEPSDADEVENVARLAGFLDLPVPATTGAPEPVAPCALAGCGGLLAPVLRGAPDVAVDSPWCGAWPDPTPGLPHGGGDEAPTTSVEHPADDPAGADIASVWPLAPGPVSPGTLRGLSSSLAAAPCLARVLGGVARGGWVWVPSLLAFGRLVEDPAWPVPETVLVRAGSWRLLEPRPAPAD